MVRFLTLFLGLAACVPTYQAAVSPDRPSAADVERAKAAVVYDFFDPDSAQFRNIVGYRVQTGDQIICGEVNAKNRFGAYVGYQGFYVRQGRNAVAKVYVDSDPLYWGTQACREAARGSIPLPAPT